MRRKEIIVVAAVFIGVLAFLYYTFFTSNYYGMKAPVRFEVKRGEALSTISENLEREGIIPSGTNFKIAAYIYGAQTKIRAGRYDIPNGLSYLDLVELFLYGKADFLKEYKMFDGTSVAYMASRLRSEFFIDSVEFVNAAVDKQLLDSLNFKAESMEGYLLPQNYYIYERSSPKEVIGILYDGFKEFMTDSLQNRAKELGYTVHEILTMASIVDGETNVEEEMPRVAGVYYNRLRIGMRLQADPTVQYLMQGGWRRLLYKDLEVDNPYNTYKYAGLPPGPINNPGKQAILASLYPEEHKYFFFVADGTGAHKFARSYTEHLKYVNEFRKWLKQQQNK